MTTRHIKLYIEQSIGALKARFADRLASRSYLHDIQHDLDSGWQIFTRDNPGPWLLAEGCAAQGMLARVLDGKLAYSWKTDFLNGPRYACKLKQGMTILGYCGPCDLYAQVMPPTQAYVFALRERGLMEWRLHDFSRLPTEPVIREGMRRARAANAFCGTKWAARALAVPTLTI
jgi:hypothetical protein